MAQHQAVSRYHIPNTETLLIGNCHKIARSRDNLQFRLPMQAGVRVIARVVQRYIHCCCGHDRRAWYDNQGLLLLIIRAQQSGLTTPKPPQVGMSCQGGGRIPRGGLNLTPSRCGRKKVRSGGETWLTLVCECLASNALASFVGEHRRRDGVHVYRQVFALA